MRAKIYVGARRVAATQRHRLVQHPISLLLNEQQPPFHHQIFPAAREVTRSFSSGKYSRDHSINDDRRPYLPWLDTRLPPEVRVAKFSEVELGKLGWQPVAYDSVALADRCCRFQDFVGMKLAHDVLDRALAEKRYYDNNRSIPEQRPFLVPYELFQKILYGWTCLATKGQIARIRMRELMDLFLQVALEEAEAFKNNTSVEKGMRLLPRVNIYNTYLTGLREAAKASSEAAILAREALDEMTLKHEHYGWHTKPNTKSYTLVINAFANTSYKGAGMEAEEILRMVQKAHQEEKENYFAEKGIPYNTEDPDANSRRIVTADAIVYANVIQAYAQEPSLKSANKTKELLLEIINVKDGTVKADVGLLTGVLSAFANLAENRRVSQEMRYSAAQQAEEILDIWLTDMSWMDINNQLGKKEGSGLVAPYNVCMNAYAKTGAPDAALKAESILQRLLSDYTEGRSSICPDTISFNTVLDAWGRNSKHLEGAPQKAEELLHLQMQLCDSEVLPESTRPDSQSFTVVMWGYARSQVQDKVTQIYRLLQELIEGMTEGKVKSDNSNLVVAFTALLGAAAFPARRETPEDETEGAPSTFESTSYGEITPNGSDDYSIALQAYRELKDDVFRIGCKPDHMVFAKMLLVVGTHTNPTSTERRQMVQMIFEDACEAGEVSKLVVKSLFKVFPDKQFVASLLHNEEFANRPVRSVDELPRLWTRNVSYKFRQLTRQDTFKRRFRGTSRTNFG